jgi:hypothetical protein
MNTVIVTEAEADKSLLLSILGAVIDAGTIKVMAAGGKSSALSLARSLLLTRSNRVGLLVDSDTVDEQRISEERASLDDALKAMAPRSRYAIFLAVPEIEATLLSEPAVTERLFGRRLSPEESVQARFEPRRVVQKLLEERAAAARRQVRLEEVLADQNVLRDLADQPLIRTVRQFIERSAVAA